MGGVEVLHPRDILNQPHHRHQRNRNNFFSMKSESVGIANSGPAVSRSSNRRKRSPPKTTLPSLPKAKTTTTLPLSVRDSNRTTSTDHKTTVKPTTAAADLVIGQIKILKRGEVLPTASSSNKVKVNVSTKDLKKQQDKISATANGVSTTDLVVLPSSSSDLPVPVPDLVPKENIRISDFFYAGSAFVTSPEPSSLPVPVFFKKKEDVSVDGDDGDHSIGNYDATSGLRRLLRLDLS